MGKNLTTVTSDYLTNDQATWLEQRAEYYVERGLVFKDACIQAKEDLFMEDDDSWREYDIDDGEEDHE